MADPKSDTADLSSIPVRVLIVDDLLATGGTAGACAELVNRVGGTLCGFAFVVELADLGGKNKLPSEVPVESLIVY